MRLFPIPKSIHEVGDITACYSKALDTVEITEKKHHWLFGWSYKIRDVEDDLHHDDWIHEDLLYY